MAKVIIGQNGEAGYNKTVGKNQRFYQKSDKELAGSVLEVGVQANKQVIKELVGDDSISQALIEIMKPQLLLREKAGLRKGIQGTVDILRDLRHGDMEIKDIIKKKYNLSDDEAEEYL